ncbi:PWWP domain-containing protein 5-like isoform X2 [Curcuma longa]|uniref:PWWP domain-containing protein 5-like isoform X2 n=1 Tax=Curcuma longa TaxID=136217 RepID=UPI003D9F6F64
MGVATRLGHPNLIGEQAKEMEAPGIDTAMKGSIAEGDMNGVVGCGQGRQYGPVLHDVKLVSKDDSVSHHTCFNTSIESVIEGDQNLNVCRQELMPKRKRGRPRKILVMQNPVDSEFAAGADRVTDNHSLTVSKHEPIARGKRGRPRKSTCKEDSLSSVANPHVNIEISSIAMGVGKENITAKRKRGRPKKLIDSEDVDSDVSVSVATNAGDSSLMETEQTLTAKRKRGRPKKLIDAEDVNSGVSASVATNAADSSLMETEQKLTAKRKRGRPPKLINIENAVSSDVAPNVGIETSNMSAMSMVEGLTVKKKRGRPRLSFVEYDERVVYQCSFQDGDSFASADLVSGKVRMHQQWPGQIFHSSTASEAALDLQKIDHHLVSCFQDKTFAWCDESQLKHFQTHLSQMEKQSCTDGFETTMNIAIEEVSRRVMLGLTCQCFMDEAYLGLKKPRIENEGVQVGACCYNIDKARIVSSFEPLNLLHYIQALACSPYARFDRLELGICESQLKSFYLSKGYSELPVFVHGEGLVDNIEDSPSNKRNFGEESPDSSTLISLAATSWMGKSTTMKNSFRREKLNIVQCRKRSEFMDNKDHYDARFDVSSHGNSEVAALDSKLEKGNDKNLGDSIISSSRSNPVRQPEVLIKSVTNEYSTPTEMLGQLYVSASNPLEEYSFLPTIVTFFADFRSWVVSVLSAEEKNTDKLAVKWDTRKSINVSSENMSAFMQDSYWSDIIVSCEEELASGWKITDESQSTQQRERHGNEPSLSLPFTSIPCSVPHLQYGSTNYSDMHKMDVQKTNERVLEDGPRYGNNLQVSEDGKPASKLLKADEFIPTALILSFHEADDIPAETDLVRIFGQYGPLMEADTEVKRSEKHAKVVFKRRSDAEAALCSAGEYSFFGPTLVSYRLRAL